MFFGGDVAKYEKYKTIQANGIFPVYVPLEGDFCGGCKVELSLNFIEKLKTNKYQIQKKTGIAESAIYNWQNGNSSPNIETIIKIANAYGCSVDFVIGRSDV